MTAERTMAKNLMVALHELPGVGWHTLQKAAAHQLWRDPQTLYKEQTWLDAGFQPAQARKSAERMLQLTNGAEHPNEKAKSIGATIVTPFDEVYPERLRQMPQPPWVLYAIGRLELLNRPSIAIVGTRNPTAYGRHTASLMARQLAERGLTIVSGLARGIDSQAHEAALHEAGGTIAVLASAVNCCYPSENRKLYSQIQEFGLLLSEAPIGAKLHPGMFPLRNRIIAGLTLGTLVVEAAQSSGSLITADQAVEMSREVFAIPGPINSPKSEGANELIGKGAKLVSRASHIIEEFPWLTAALDRDTAEKTAVSHRSAGNGELSRDELKVIELLQDKPMTMNELHQRTAFPFGHLSALLINLCIKRKIAEQPGSLYIVM
ncbi:DNA-processing protein DprA [Paenibacillus sp. NEAU-GSW1]|uniref:DNA-processing protein DprA n=1 Tax=Paenibacillus sp. NEAU-GSW1 TaxID=2682486 RepID=UPI0012E2BFA0|nr:DNA-processing protein DprA [Paenibacillus sp. NEAU-GSW1]MUT66341.1 DNA-protecting protein DprA [Paenibacillus sp. NEAU-GSW1]